MANLFWEIVLSEEQLGQLNGNTFRAKIEGGWLVRYEYEPPSKQIYSDDGSFLGSSPVPPLISLTFVPDPLYLWE